MTNRSTSVLILLAATIVVGIALMTQYVGGLQPCELCLYERWPYYAAIPVALIAAAVPQRIMLALLALIFIAGSVLAFYHVGVEQHWFAGPSSCTGGIHANSIEDLKRLLESRQPVACDAPQWSFMGVTLAGLNFIASVLIALFALWSWRRAR